MQGGELVKSAILGRYEIVEKIAVGGMAEIYLGRMRANPTKLVAIKRVLPHFASDRKFVDMFLEEARLASKLRHPNIADVLDVGIDHESYYFAMEYIHGADVRAIRLAAEERDTRVPLGVTIAIVHATAAALAYAHTMDGPDGPLHLVHRDISPSNILVSYDGEVKLVDFGIARAETGSNSKRTSTNALEGKIPYMSPEQCRALALDARSDLFSLGIVLYELTTGVRPFDKESEFETLEMIVHGQAPAPSQHVEGYPGFLQSIILKMLANRPPHRYQTARELLVDLERFAAAEELVTTQLSVAKYMRSLFNMRRADSDDYAEMETMESPPEPPPQRPTAAPPPPSVSITFRAPSTTRPPTNAVVEERTDVTLPVTPDTDPFEFVPPADDPKEVEVVRDQFARATAARAAGDREAALSAIELALASNRSDPAIAALLAEHDGLIAKVFSEYIGDPSRTLAVSRHLEELTGQSIDQRAAFLLSRIDGTLSVDDLLVTSGMPIRETYRHLCQLVLRGLVLLV